MTEHNIKERVAAGLRHMSKHPDYFLFIPTEEVPYWIDSILEIPVLYTDAFIRFTPYSDTECPFLPCFLDEESTNNMKAYNFGRGYYEWGENDFSFRDVPAAGWQPEK